MYAALWGIFAKHLYKLSWSRSHYRLGAMTLRVHRLVTTNALDSRGIIIALTRRRRACSSIANTVAAKRQFEDDHGDQRKT
ncbi:unnamed protein product [Toxocara canis]|uniref:Secreted protein n=1 Tax=Toxocara canis TaxID=6265 RepID=A0A183UM42_TOXCA|nr:unnamed protein product [Toxocara canis]